jgi:hypothetical protein
VLRHATEINFTFADLRFILSHFKHQIEEKMVLDDENRMLIEEIDRLTEEIYRERRLRSADEGSPGWMLPAIEEEEDGDEIEEAIGVGGEQAESLKAAGPVGRVTVPERVHERNGVEPGKFGPKVAGPVRSGIGVIRKKSMHGKDIAGYIMEAGKLKSSGDEARCDEENGSFLRDTEPKAAVTGTGRSVEYSSERAELSKLPAAQSSLYVDRKVSEKTVEVQKMLEVDITQRAVGGVVQKAAGTGAISRSSDEVFVATGDEFEIMKQCQSISAAFGGGHSVGRQRESEGSVFAEQQIGAGSSQTATGTTRLDLFVMPSSWHYYYITHGR